MTDPPTRRTSDIDLAVQLAISEEVRAVSDSANEKITETRHALRNEIAALGTKVDLFAVQSTKEHSEVASKLDRLSDDVAGLKALAGDVAALKIADARSEAASAAAEKLLTRQRNQFFALATLIVGAAGVIVAVIH